MINIPLPEENLFERLKTRTGYAEFIQNFAARLLIEPKAISDAVLHMEKSLVHPATAHASKWARTSDVVAKAIGLETTSALMNTKLEMERLGVNLVGTAFTPTPEITAQEEPVATTNVSNLDAHRERRQMAGLQTSTVVQPNDASILTPNFVQQSEIDPGMPNIAAIRAQIEEIHAPSIEQLRAEIPIFAEAA